MPRAAACLLLAAAALAGTARAAPPGARLLENGPERIVFEYELPEWELRDVEEAGETWQRIAAPGGSPSLRAGWPEVPLIPVSLGLPVGVTPRLEVQVLEQETRAGVRLIPAPVESFESLPPREAGGEPWKVPRARIEADPGAYASPAAWPEAAAELRPPGSFRHQRTVAVVCSPFRYVAASRELHVARRIRVTLRLEPDAESRRDAQAAGLAWLPAPAERPEVEAIYGATLLNAAGSRPWRRQGAEPRPAARAAGGGYTPNALEYRLIIGESGIHRVVFADLPGFPAGVPVSALKVFQRRYVGGSPPIVEDKVPLRIGEGSGAPGIFDAGDGLFFFARSFREQYVTENTATGSQGDPPGDWEDTYTSRNVYWLSYETGGGSPSMPVEAAMKGFVAPAVPASFEYTAFGERDSIHFDFQRRREMDADFWAPDGVLIPFNVPGIVNTRPAQLTVRMLFGYAQVLPTFASRTADLFIQQPGGARVGVGNISLQDDGLVQDFQATLASPSFLNGQQSFALLDTLRTTNPNEQGWIDWYRFRYQRAYRLENYESRLRMTNGGATGDLEFRVGGFAGSGVHVYRLDGAGGAAFLSTPAVAAEGGGTFEARFQHHATGATEYIALASNAYLSPLGISRLEGLPDLVNDDALAPDYLMIAHDPFVAGTQPLADYRNENGHRVRLTPVSRVYDLFGNGNPSPQAIKNYIRHAYESWNAAYVLLVGDASRDERGVAVNEAATIYRSDPNYIPTWYLLDFAPEDRYFLRAHDNWYGDLSPGADWIAEVSLGRFPVGNLEELAVVVGKTIAFEENNLDEPWRRRVVWLADDHYVWNATGASDCYDGLQRDFADATSEMIAAVDAAASGGMTSDYFHLKSWTDQHDATHRCDSPGCCVSALGAIEWTRANATPALMGMLNQGQLIWNYQGHANREVFTHEYVYREDADGVPLFGTDSDDFTNGERPFIFLGYACYISMFDARLEPQVGDGIGERMLLEAGGGAAALYASPGLEFLSPNTVLNQSLVANMWSDGYQPGDGAGMVLGPCITAGVRLFADTYGWVGSYRAYHVLGDPALRIEGGPPRVAVTVNDSLAVDGSSLASYVSAGTAEIVAEVADEGGLAELTLTNTLVGPGPLAPGVDYTVTALADSGRARPRRQRIEYAISATLEQFLQMFDVVLAAEDPNGNRRTFTLRSGLSVTAESNGVGLVDGIVLPPRPELRVRVDSPLPIDGDLLGLRLDGETRDDVIRTPLAARSGAAAGADSSSRWELSLPPLDLALGTHLLETTFQLGDSLLVMSSLHFTLRDDVTFGYAFCYPNPFSRATSFVFQLSPAAESVELQIYTVAGRRIRTLAGGPTSPAPGSQNQVAWDGRDDSGDEVASGVYLYRARARSVTGAVTVHQGQVVKIAGAR